MPTPYNKDLKLQDYKLYLAMGKSKEQLDAYDKKVQAYAEAVETLVEDNGAQMAQLSVGHAQKTLIGLVFTEEIPLGWKHKFQLYASPDLDLGGPYHTPDNINLIDSWVDDPHHYLNAPVGYSKDSRKLFVLAAKVEDEWVIACPRGKDGWPYEPEGAAPLSLYEYKTVMGYDLTETPLSPSEDERYTDHPLLMKYPFSVQEEYQAKYDSLIKEFWSANHDNSKPLVPVQQMTMRDKIRQNVPILGKLGL